MSIKNDVPALVSAVSPGATPRLLLLAVAALASSTGCQGHVFSPPARTVPL